MSSTVKEIRQRLGMTQAALGAAIGVPGRTILSWERSYRNISPEFAKKMAQYATYAGVPTTLDDIYNMPKRPDKKKAKKADKRD